MASTVLGLIPEFFLEMLVLLDIGHLVLILYASTLYTLEYLAVLLISLLIFLSLYSIFLLSLAFSSLFLKILFIVSVSL